VIAARNCGKDALLLNRHAILTIRNLTRRPVYRMLNYERNHSRAKGAQMDAIQAIIGSEVISRVNSELFRDGKISGICHRSAAFWYHRGDFYLVGLRSRGCAESISAAHRKLRMHLSSRVGPQVDRSLPSIARGVN